MFNDFDGVDLEHELHAAKVIVAFGVCALMGLLLTLAAIAIAAMCG